MDTSWSVYVFVFAWRELTGNRLQKEGWRTVLRWLAIIKKKTLLDARNCMPRAAWEANDKSWRDVMGILWQAGVNDDSLRHCWHCSGVVLLLLLLRVTLSMTGRLRRRKSRRLPWRAYSTATRRTPSLPTVRQPQIHLHSTSRLVAIVLPASGAATVGVVGVQTPQKFRLGCPTS